MYNYYNNTNLKDLMVNIIILMVMMNKTKYVIVLMDANVKDIIVNTNNINNINTKKIII